MFQFCGQYRGQSRPGAACFIGHHGPRVLPRERLLCSDASRRRRRLRFKCVLPINHHETTAINGTAKSASSQLSAATGRPRRSMITLGVVIMAAATEAIQSNSNRFRDGFGWHDGYPARSQTTGTPTEHSISGISCIEPTSSRIGRMEVLDSETHGAQHFGRP